MSSSQPARKRLPVKPSEENLKKQAKRRAKLENIQLAQAQHLIATDYGSRNWAELMHVVEVMLRGADQLSFVQAKMEPLVEAANRKDIAAVRAILDAGPFTQHDLDKALARSVLAYGERGQIAKLLIDHGADPDGQYGSDYGPIVFVTGECLDPDGLQFLIDHGADVSFEPIDTKYGKQCPLSHTLGTYLRGRNDRKHRIIDLLLSHGAVVPAEVTPAVLAIHRGDAKTLADLLDKEPAMLRQRFATMPYGNINLAGATLLHCAVEFGEIECLDVLFERYADINMKADIIDGIGGQTPIFHAINTNGDGNFFTLEYLIKRVGRWIDMSVNVTWRSYGKVQSTPLTPLEYAEKAQREIDPKWADYRPRVKDELDLVRSLDRRHQIRQACSRGDAGAVAQMLDATPELLTPELWPPTIFQGRSLAITRLLLDRGLDPNQCSAPRKPLHLACSQGLADIARLLIQRGARLDVVDGENITPYELMCCAPGSQPNIDELRAILRDAGARDSVFTHIYLRNDQAAIDMIRDNPAIVRAQGPIWFTPLQTAARAARPTVVKALLEIGADVNAKNPRENTALWFACQSSEPAEDRIAVAELLIEAGARVRDACEDGTTALHFAAWRGPVEMVELLLRHGAKPPQPDRHGKTAADHARRGNAADKPKILELLERSSAGD